MDNFVHFTSQEIACIEYAESENIQSKKVHAHSNENAPGPCDFQHFMWENVSVVIYFACGDKLT